MRRRDYAAAAAGVLGRALLWLDMQVASLLPGDRRPLIDVACDVAAWLGRTWRRCQAEVRTRRYGPGRGVIAIVITPRTTEKKETDRG
ncbi:hypothetical protein SUDANB121_05962 (plasmid) [Nocardiopsis dassonvillei]|uniref:hypothetical protein n=1 Tax=Nocardiopsis dassonvillei TaxID=2014 RepID=UPI003F57D404